MQAIAEASQETLIETYGILERSRDEIRMHDFINMNAYGAENANGERCYIGTIDWVAGHPSLDKPADSTTPAHRLALEALDHIALTLGATGETAFASPGGIAEHWGHYEERTTDVPAAIDLFEKAMAQVYAGLTGPSREVICEPIEQPQPVEEPVEPVKETEPERELIPA